MKGNTLLALAILPFVGALSADSATQIAYGNDHDSRDNRVAVRPAPGTDQHGPDQFEHDNTYGVSLYGDYIYMKPYVSNMPWAQSSQGSTTSAEIGWAQYSTLDAINFAFNGDSAFRIGAAYESEWNTIGFAVDWMSFHSTQTNRRQGADGTRQSTAAGQPEEANRILPFYTDDYLTPGQVVGGVANARGTFGIKFDTVDYRMTSDIQPTTYVHLQPTLGIRTLYSRNSLDTTFWYNLLGTAIINDGDSNTLDTYLSQKYNAIGTLMGSRALFEIADGFRFVTDCAFSYVVGQNKTDYSAYLTYLPGSRAEAVKDYQTYFKSMYDLQAGLQYEWMTDERDFGLLFEVAYEAHFYPQFIAFFRHAIGRGAGGATERGISLNPAVEQLISDYAMQGLHVRGGMTF